MKNIEEIKDRDLLSSLSCLARNERSAIAEVVLYLHHLDKRGLYRDAGYGSLFSYCTEKLKYSEGAACRRIAAARALSTSPELYTLLKEGQMTLCAVSQIAKVITPENKGDILRDTAGKTKLEVQKITSDYCEAKKPSREKIRAKKVTVPAANDLFSNTQEEKERRFSVTLELTEDEMELVQEARKMLGKGEIKDVLLRGAADLKKRKENAATPRVAPTVAVKLDRPRRQSRYIPAAVQREVKTRDGHQCTFCGPDGQRCSERYRLEIDHIRPYALGGKNETENLRLVCRAHNSLYAERVFGREKIRHFQGRSKLQDI